MEAAQIDGAGKWTKKYSKSRFNDDAIHYYCMFLSLTDGFKLFDQNLSLTAGEPSKMSEMMALNIFNTFYGRTGWERCRTGKAVLFFILVVAIKYDSVTYDSSFKGGAAINEKGKEVLLAQPEPVYLQS